MFSIDLRFDNRSRNTTLSNMTHYMNLDDIYPGAFIAVSVAQGPAVEVFGAIALNFVIKRTCVFL